MSLEAQNANPQLVGPAQPAKPAGAAPTTAVTAPAAPAVVEAVPVPGPLASLNLPFQGTSFTLKGYHAAASVSSDAVVSAAELLDKEGFALDTITGVDWLAEGQMEIVYDYFHPVTGLRAVIRTRVPREKPQLPTISAVFPGANWHEREAHDFFGIQFNGHPNLTPFLLPEDATYHPLRKDFTS